MDKFNNRQKDLTQVFNERWKANYHKNEDVDKAKKEFNFRVYGIKDKEDTKREMREFNSVASQVDRLNQKMNTIRNNNFKKM